MVLLPTSSAAVLNEPSIWYGHDGNGLLNESEEQLAAMPRPVFFVIALQSRRVTIAGIHPQPYGAWMEQMARNLTDPVDGCLRRARYLIHDRDPLYTRVFGEILEGGGVQPIRLPPKSPNLNAYAERFVRSIKEECLSRVVPSARRTCGSSCASPSNTIIASETTRDSTISCCNDHHRR